MWQVARNGVYICILCCHIFFRGWDNDALSFTLLHASRAHAYYKIKGNNIDVYPIL